MLYGTQVGNHVVNNKITRCGYGRGPIWKGRKPYRTGGIAALTISQKQHDSPINGCYITDNEVSECPVGLEVGIALWDGSGNARPRGMHIAGNRYSNCQIGETINIDQGQE